MNGVISSETENSKTIATTQAKNSGTAGQKIAAGGPRADAESGQYSLRHLRTQPRHALWRDGGYTNAGQPVGVR